MNFIIICLFFFLITFGFSIVINRIFLKFSSNVGRRNTQNLSEVRWTPNQKPAFGGITFFIVFLLSVVSFLLINSDQAILMNNKEFLGFIAAATIAFLTGLFDDAFNTRPILKFACQLLAAIILILSGTIISICDNFYVNSFITIFWIVGIINSINLLDNMDAISSVVVLGILGSLFILILNTSSFETHYIYIIVGLFAAILGFLVFNWHPSKLFMGDSGSLFLGLVIAFFGIKFTWNMEFNSSDTLFLQDSLLLRKILLSLLIFILPISDTTSVFFKRIIAGRTPFKGGKDHTTHHFVYLGIRESLVACIFIFLSLLITLSVYLMISVFYNWNMFLFISYFVFIISIFALLFIVAYSNKDKDAYN